MSRSVAIAFIVALIATGCGDRSATNESADPVVNVYNWFDYIDPAALPAFTHETGVAVNYDTFDSDEILEAKLLAGNSGYDVVVPSYAHFARQISAGVFREIDRSRLPHWHDLDPYVLDKLVIADPGNRYGVPHAWGTTGLGVNVDLIRARMPDAPLDSWALLFDPDIVRRFADCGVVMLDAPGDVVESTLIAIGRDPSSQTPANLDAAFAALKRVRPFVRYFHSSQSVDDLANGEICLALMWSGGVYQSMHANPRLNLKYVIPIEGASLWFDVWAIPADATNVDNAYRFIDYMLRPNAAAGFTNATFYPSGDGPEVDGVDARLRNEAAIYPPSGTRQRLHSPPPETVDYERRRMRLWTELKAGAT